MSRWYYLSPSFDGDMDLTEMIINFQTSNIPKDADIIQGYYLSRAKHYWNKFEESASFETLKEYKEYHPTMSAYLSKRHSYKIANTYNRLTRLRSEIEELRKTFDTMIMKVSESYEDLLLHYQKDKYKNILRNNIMNLFFYVAELLCGYANYKEIDSKVGTFPLTNNSGHFSFNSYIYALTYNIHLVGVPSRFSEYDRIVDCPAVFLAHDIDHAKSIKDERLKYLDLYYEHIMKSNLTTNQKEACIFTLWYTLHELYISVVDTRLDIVCMRLNTRTISGIRLEKQYWQEVKEIAEKYSVLADYAEEELLIIIHYIEGRIPEPIDEIELNRIEGGIAILYGTSLIEKIKL